MLRTALHHCRVQLSQVFHSVRAVQNEPLHDRRDERGSLRVRHQPRQETFEFGAERGQHRLLRPPSREVPERRLGTRTVRDGGVGDAETRARPQEGVEGPKVILKTLLAKELGQRNIQEVREDGARAARSKRGLLGSAL